MSKFEKKESKISLREIKSFYIIKLVFSFLNEKQKLNMIIYNKEIQDKLNVNFIDLKRISGKYKEGEKNGKGKVYIY